MANGEAPASPPLFYFKLRLVGERHHEAELDLLSGGPPRNVTNPFAHRPFRLRWGASTVVSTTTQDGVVTAEVDGSHASGTLELGDRDDAGAFHVRLTIPVESRPPGTQLDELYRLMRNLGWVEDDSRAALRDALLRYVFRRSFCGSVESTRRFQRVVRSWQDDVDEILRGGAALDAIMRELHVLHDRTQRTR